MTPKEIEILRFIRATYGEMLLRAAAPYRHRPEVLAGIMMRETAGGLSQWLDKPGPKGRGDNGHGHGLMQIDDRSFPEFCKGPRWADPEGNIYFGASVLSSKLAYITRHAPHLDAQEIERAGIAAYNCGEGNVMKCLNLNVDVDTRTAHGNYSRAVLAFALEYLKGEDPGL